MNRSADALIINNRRVLLLLRDNIPTIQNPNKWGLIGGRIEKGETVDEGMLREIKEESNLSPKNIKYYGKLAYSNEETSVYVVRLKNSELANIQLGDEGQELRFFTFDELSTIALADGMRPYIDKFSAEIKHILAGEDVPPRDLGLEV